MPPRATGSIETHHWADGRTVTFRLRVRSNGVRYRIDLGTNHEGWNHARAQVELDLIQQQIARGTWQPPEKTSNAAARTAAPEAETLHVTISRWWQRRKVGLKPTTQNDYRWRIDHILRVLAGTPTAAIDARAVDDLREVLAGALGPSSVNKVLGLLAQVLDDAVDYKMLEVNPARGRRRRMKEDKPNRSFLEADMVLDLLEAAGEWEREVPPHQRYGRRHLLALLCLSGGARISAAANATGGDVDLNAQRWRVPDDKTPAGVRDIELTAFTLDELHEHRAQVKNLGRRTGPYVPFFPTRTGGRLNASNIRNRLLQNEPPDEDGKRYTLKHEGGEHRVERAPSAVERANDKRAAEGRMLLPAKVTPHTFRRTFASLALLAGREPRWVMGQIGHTDARLTLEVYAQITQRRNVDYDLVWRLMRFSDEPETWTGSRR